MKYFFISLRLCLLTGLWACQNQKEILTTEATLRWTGPLAADGCGFFLDINGQELKPVNEEVIPSAFQNEAAQRVQVRYQLLEEPQEYSCGMLPSRYSSTLKVLEIKPL